MHSYPPFQVVSTAGPINMNLVFAVNQGASFGPRIATVRFSLDLPRARGLHVGSVTLGADADAAQFRDEGELRRRAARRVITFGRQFAKDAPGLTPQAISRGGNEDFHWWDLELFRSEVVDGLPRHARGHVKVRALADAAAPAMEEEDRSRIAKMTKVLVEALHGAISNPENFPIFGRAE